MGIGTTPTQRSPTGVFRQQTFAVFAIYACMPTNGRKLRYHGTPRMPWATLRASTAQCVATSFSTTAPTPFMCKPHDIVTGTIRRKITETNVLSGYCPLQCLPADGAGTTLLDYAASCPTCLADGKDAKR